MREVPSGPYEGYLIRRARKPGKCSNYRRGCTVEFKAGDEYVEGDGEGGLSHFFARERLCFECAECPQPVPSNKAGEQHRSNAP